MTYLDRLALLERPLRSAIRAGDIRAVRLALKVARLRELERPGLERPVRARELAEHELAALVADIRRDATAAAGPVLERPVKVQEVTEAEYALIVESDKSERLPPWRPGDRPRGVYIVRPDEEQEGDG